MRATWRLQGHLFQCLHLVDEETNGQRGQEACSRSHSLLTARERKAKSVVGGDNICKRAWALPEQGTDQDRPPAMGKCPVFSGGRRNVSYKLGPSQLLWCPISLHPSPEQCWLSHRPRHRPCHRPFHRPHGAFGSHGPQQTSPIPVDK